MASIFQFLGSVDPAAVAQGGVFFLAFVLAVLSYSLFRTVITADDMTETRMRMVTRTVYVFAGLALAFGGAGIYYALAEPEPEPQMVRLDLTPSSFAERGQAAAGDADRLAAGVKFALGAGANIPFGDNAVLDFSASDGKRLLIKLDVLKDELDHLRSRRNDLQRDITRLEAEKAALEREKEGLRVQNAKLIQAAARPLDLLASSAGEIGP